VAPNDEIVVEQYGGTVGEIAMGIVGMAVCVADEQSSSFCVATSTECSGSRRLGGQIRGRCRTGGPGDAHAPRSCEVGIVGSRALATRSRSTDANAVSAPPPRREVSHENPHTNLPRPDGIGALLLPAPASALYFLIGDNRPAAGWARRRRRKPGCVGSCTGTSANSRVAACRTQLISSSTPDIVGAADKTAITNAFTTWKTWRPPSSRSMSDPTPRRRSAPPAPAWTRRARPTTPMSRPDARATRGVRVQGAVHVLHRRRHRTCMNAVCRMCGSSIGNDGENAILWDDGSAEI
jgi:hypothetical protein